MMSQNDLDNAAITAALLAVAAAWIEVLWDMRKLPKAPMPDIPILGRRYIGMTDTHDTGRWSCLIHRNKGRDVRGWEDCV